MAGNYVSNNLSFLFYTEQTLSIEFFITSHCIVMGGEYATDLDTCKRAAILLQEHNPAMVVDSTHYDFLSQTQPKGCFARY